MSTQIICRFDRLEQMSRAAALKFVRTVSSAQEKTGHAAVVLSGGSTPRHLYELLADEPYKSSIDWGRIFFFWGDERCVSENDPQSNYRMAYVSLLCRVPVAPERVLRIPVELGWEEAAFAYDDTVKKIFDRRAADAPCKTIFDFTLLGVGADGHTASIFPGSPALHECKQWVLPVEAPPAAPVRRRITLTRAALSSSEAILILAGAEKKNIIEELFEKGGADAARYPAAAFCGESTQIFLADPQVDRLHIKSRG